MKQILLAIALVLIAVPAHAQEKAKTQKELPRWNIRIYPLAHITNIRTEIGYRFSENWEVNLLASYYHHKYFIYRGSTEKFHNPFYVPVAGNQLYISIEKRLKNNHFSLGGRFGYRNLIGQEFDIAPSFDSYELVTPEHERLDFVCVARYKTNLQGVFVEFTAQAGLSYNMEEEAVEQTVGDTNIYYFYYVTNYWFPAFALGVNVGFGW